MPKRKQLTDVFKLIQIGGPDECWNYTGRYSESRRMPEFDCDGRKLCPYVVVWELVTGVPLGPDEILLHRCDNRRCCNVRHMRPGDRSTNNTEAAERELDHGLSHKLVREIRRILNANNHPTHQQIADMYGIARETVTAINNGRSHQTTKDEDDVAITEHQG